MQERGRSRRRCGVIALLAAAGCASYGDWVERMELHIAHGQSERALRVLDRYGGARRDGVLYLLNKAMLLRMQGDFAASAAALEETKPLIERRSVASVSETAGALAVNDLLRSYTGAPFERMLLHVYAALDYLELGDPGAARVEALQLDVLLEQRAGLGPGEDAFARYLTGMVFEALGEWDDAMIAYRQAYRAYRRAQAPAVPRALGLELLRLAERQGLGDELEEYRAAFALERWPSATERARQGEVIFLLHSGLAPLKRETGSGVVTEAGQIVTVAVPYYAGRAPLVAGARVRAGAVAGDAELVQDVEALAFAALEREMPAILARAAARAALKLKASDEARKKDEAVGFAVNVAGAVTERADTRSWSTLPNRIYLARLALDPGRYRIDVELLDRYGAVAAQRSYADIAVEAGAIRFLSLHWVAAADIVTDYPLPQRRRRVP